MLPVEVQEKEYLFRFLPALGCLFKDMSKKQGPPELSSVVQRYPNTTAAFKDELLSLQRARGARWGSEG